MFMRLPAILLSLVAVALAAPPPRFFITSVYPVFQKAGCSGCHNPEGVASATRLHFPEPNAAPAAIESFGASLALLVDRDRPENSLLLKKPTKRIAHAGGLRIQPGSPEETALKTWIDYLATLPAPSAARANTDAPPPAVKVAPVLRFLTRVQYNNTVRDLLHDDTRLADQFPPEDFVNGFKGQYQSQSISPLLAEAYAGAAEKLARNAFRGGDSHQLIPCKPTGPSDAGCRDSFIEGFGKRAFRRPLTKAEHERYSRLFAEGVATCRDFLGGAQLLVEAMLQSPNFLARVENGAAPEWRAYETASRLSYFLWNTMPDDALMKSAENGELDTAAGVDRVARRMLKDVRARAGFDEFIAEWLRFDRVSMMVKDRRAFPMFTPELASAMTEETRRLADDLVWNNRDFMKLFSADYSFLSANLAALYGVPAPEADFGRVALPANSGRAGILGQALFLAASSKPEDTSPTARGLFVREQFLCQEVPPPPPGVNTNLPVLSKDRPLTTQERLAMHTTNESCRGCHALIDPIGFGLEKFDALGQRREKMKLTFHPEHGDKEGPQTVELPFESKGSIAGIRDSNFTNAAELGQVLEHTPQCQQCVVKQLFRYAAGRHDTRNDELVIKQAYDDFKGSGFQFQELLVALSKYLVFPPGRNEVDGLGTH
jgi:hypothetical protein